MQTGLKRKKKQLLLILPLAKEFRVFWGIFSAMKIHWRLRIFDSLPFKAVHGIKLLKY
jgi:hypothetical protein